MKLGTALKRENNNADLLRLIAACAVIWGHAYYLIPGVVEVEPIGRVLGFDYSGSLAVEFFFFLSGILVTNSWLNNSSPIHFALARIFRVFPAVVVSALFCILCIGPLVTTLPLADYFSDKSVFLGVLSHPHIEYMLPGVFTHLKSPHVNGSIWTIRYELVMYMMLLAAGLCGVFRHRKLATPLLIGIIFVSLAYPERIELLGLTNMNMAGHLPAFFAFGALLAIYKTTVNVGFTLVAGLALLTWVFRNGPAFQFVFYPAFLMATLWLMTTAPIKRLRLPGDFSYGVYVFGWPMQQLMMMLFPTFGVHENQAATVLSSLLLAVLSWYIIEKPCIGLGRKLSHWLSPRVRHEIPSDPGAKCA